MPSPLSAGPLLQAGRAGRREQPSLGIYLGWDGPLDQVLERAGASSGRREGMQGGAARRRGRPFRGPLTGCTALPPSLLSQYFMQHPDQLFGRPVERAAVDARNPSVLGEAKRQWRQGRAKETKAGQLVSLSSGQQLLEMQAFQQ